MEQKSDQRNFTEEKTYPIEIRNLSVTYRTEPALWNIDLDFPEGKADCNCRSKRSRQIHSN